MAGSQTLPLRCGRFAAVLALSFFTFVGRARRRTRHHRYRRPECRTRASPRSRSPRRSRVDGLIAIPQPSYYRDPGVAPPGTAGRAGSLRHDHRVALRRRLRRGQMAAALARQLLQRRLARALGRWSRRAIRPDAAPRVAGVVRRRVLPALACGRDLPEQPEQAVRREWVRGQLFVFLPFSRRFETVLNVPFVAANGTTDPTRGYRSDFGDLPSPRRSCSRRRRLSHSCSPSDRADGSSRDGRAPDDGVPALLVLEQPGRGVGGAAGRA